MTDSRAQTTPHDAEDNLLDIPRFLLRGTPEFAATQAKGEQLLAERPPGPVGARASS